MPRLESQTVLDVVTYIQRALDPTLAYRFACRVGMCGSCAMTVNGRARWTCRTHVDKVAEDGRLEIAPLRNLPVVRDLVTDMAAFFDKWAKARGRFQGGTTRKDDFARVPPDSPARRAGRRRRSSASAAACATARATSSPGTPTTSGPAALNRAWTLVNDARDTGNRARLAAVAGDAGCHACHTHMSCTERCPKQISPTAAIAGLKRAAMAAAIKGEI